MLCLLEEKGVVTSEYQRASDKRGPGRAERVFCPVETAQAREQRLKKGTGGETLAGEELEQFVLDRLHSGEIWDKELVEQILARIPPDGQGQLRYCMEVMTFIALRLQKSSRRRIVLEYLPEILPSNAPAYRNNLCLLGGFAFGILAQEGSSDPEWTRELFENMQRFLDIVTKMNQEDCRQLREYLVAVFTPLTV